MRTILLFITTLLFAGNLFGQSLDAASTYIKYTYDASGNRISRTIEMDASKSSEADGTKSAPVVEYTDQLAETEITIYPNPTQGRLTVKIANISQDASGSIALFDMNGRQILRQESIVTSNELDISEQPIGTYLMQIMIDEESTSWKIIKR
jgi:YD repeat-containing protein